MPGPSLINGYGVSPISLWNKSRASHSFGEGVTTVIYAKSAASRSCRFDGTGFHGGLVLALK
jgi:hypothetical protein